MGESEDVCGWNLQTSIGLVQSNVHEHKFSMERSCWGMGRQYEAGLIQRLWIQIEI